MHAIQFGRLPRLVRGSDSTIQFTRRCLLTTGALLLTAASATADYSFEQIDAPGISTSVLGINNNLDLVGTFVGADDHHDHGFIIRFGGFGQFDVEGARDTQVRGINDAGDVVGYYFDGSRSFGFVLPNGGQFQSLSFNPSTVANGINNVGQIVGTAGRFGFLLDGNDFTIIDDGSASTAGASGINDSGDIVGSARFSFADQSGFIRTSDGLYIPFIVPGADFTYPSGINNVGQVVGACLIDGRYHGFLVSDGAITLIDVDFDATSTFVSGINDDGVIVGSFLDPQGNSHGFIGMPL